ncbi:MAG: ATP-binding protein [Clostridium sp.]|nr:MAG: ATP-binding protein [Clostridium sp.]
MMQILKSQNGNLLLERFNRGDSIRGEISGSGIGLSLVNEIVNLHNGTIDIDVKDGSYECLICF